MLRFIRRPASTLLIVLFATFPGLVFAGDEQTNFSVTELTAEYAGDLAGLIEAEAVQPLSLASADLDEDGLPDLVVGHGDGDLGLFAVHFGNVEAIYPSAGTQSGPAFLPIARVFTAATRADHIATGDFDADGHFDVITATAGGTTLELHRGDGSGLFHASESIELGGRLTTLAAGEVNRRDGLADVVVGIDLPSGSKILVFESPVGALRGAPEIIDATEKVTSIELDYRDDDSFRDIVADTESYQITIVGRDRRLSVGGKQRAEVADAVAIAEPFTESAHANKSTMLPLATNIGGNIVAHISMRLNRDAFPDRVAITEESPVPVVIKTLTRATFTVDSTTDDPDFDTGDGVCDTDDTVGDGPCTLRAAIEQANTDTGADAIEFDIPGTGPHTIQPVSALPTITDAVTIDGFTQPGSSANTIAFPGGLDSVLQIELDGSAGVSAMNGLALSAGNCVVRGLAINRMRKNNNIYLGSGIYLNGSADSIVEGNFIGTDPGGTTALPNEFNGVFAYSGGAGNTYGGTAPPARNLISGPATNLSHREGDGALIQGNLIGTEISGTISLNPGTGSGIYLVSAEGYGGSTGDNHTVGGTTAGAGNLVSGLYYGISLVDDTSGNLVQGNLIGPDSSGALVLGNVTHGIRVYWNENNTIGGTSPAARNVISGLGVGWAAGINVQEAPGTQVQGNYIGTDVAGTAGHSYTVGLQLNMLTSGVTIGGAVPGAGNLIAASLEDGILLGDSSNVIIQGNAIGIDSTGSPLPNSWAGISIYGSDNITIGGTAPGEGNTISSNGGAGVEIGNSYATSDPGIKVVGNSIYSNGLLGIDLDADGVTTNDVGDSDTGSNGLQNFPVITGVANMGTLIQGTLNSLASTQYELAFYSSPSCDTSGYGEGRFFLGTDSVTTDGTGNAAISTTLAAAVAVGSFITATATAPDGSTSEFSMCLEYSPSADLQVTMDDGVTDVLPGDQLTYTIVASNSGPDGMPDATFGANLGYPMSCSTTCIAAGGATCSPGPMIDDVEEDVLLPVGGTATYTAVCDVDLTATGIIEASAGIDPPEGATDPDWNNNEDIDIDTVLPVDWGDAPDPNYPTLPASDGARHQIDGSLHLGSLADADPGGQPTTSADGDDNDGTDDEDGVTFTSIVMTGFNADLEVTASATGVLNVWLDLDGNGSWLDAGEQIFTDASVGSGINPLTFAVPATAVPGDSYARFRLDSVGGLAPTGFATDGEVEDELVEIRFSTLDIAETGQTTSFAAGDDGAFQMGVPWPDPRFTDNGDGSISDELTGLMWTQDNVNPGPAPCNPGVTRNWFDSLTYVDCLNSNLGHDDWRMPNIVEINSLMHYQVADHRPWWASQGFTMTTNFWWWSSTNIPNGLSSVHTLSVFAVISGRNKLAVTGGAVWPVRGGPTGGAVQLPATGQVRCWNASYSEVPCAGTGQDGDHRAGAAWPSPRFEVSGDCVTDRLTGLTWTKDADLFGTRSWYDGLNDALDLSLCGYDDWRLPTVLELRSLYHYDTEGGSAFGTLAQWWLSSGFVNIPNGPAWSSTTFWLYQSSAWGLWSDDSKDRDDYHVVWPVRGNLQSDPADLAVVVTDSPDPIDLGANVVYTVEASNLGPTAATDVVVTTTLPAGSIFIGAAGAGWICGEVDLVVGCSMAGLGIGAAAPITIEITPQTFGTVVATTVVDSLRDDPVGDNNSDIEVTSVIAYDFGDVPDPTYPTLLAANGANHVLGSGLHLGALVDDEPDGQPSAGADGDDLDGSDDEDGVVLASTLLAGADEGVQVTASAAGLLDAWIDFNADGDWDDVGEQVFTAESLAAGSNALSVAVPLDATTGATFARFRLSSAGGLTPTGSAADGEVEDYGVIIDPSAEIAVEIADSPDPVPEGGRLSYFISVRNNGQLEATGVVLTDTLPAEVSFVAASLPACVEASGTVTCDLVSVLPGTSTAIEIEVDVDYGFEGTITNSAAAVLNEADPAPANNTDEEITRVVDEPTYIFSDGFETGDTDRWSETS